MFSLFKLRGDLGPVLRMTSILFTFLHSTVPPDFCEDKDPEGLYANPDNCENYIQCPPGQCPVIMPCPACLLWNTETDQCDYPQNVDCGERPSKLILPSYAHQRKTELVT